MTPEQMRELASAIERKLYVYVDSVLDRKIDKAIATLRREEEQLIPGAVRTALFRMVKKEVEDEVHVHVSLKSKP
jgi:hypothetical protein